MSGRIAAVTRFLNRRPAGRASAAREDGDERHGGNDANDSANHVISSYNGGKSNNVMTIVVRVGEWAGEKSCTELQI
jgi:hypothetical protein